MSKGGTVSVSYVVNNSEFNTKVNDMKRNMSLLQAEVKNSAKEVDLYGSNIQTLSKKHSTINDAIKQTQKIMSTYNTALEKNKASLTSNQAELTKLASKKKEINSQYKQAVKVYGEESTQAKQLKASLDEVNNQYESMNSKVKSNKANIVNYTTQIEKQKTTLIDLQSQLKATSEELEKQSNKFLSASESFAHFGDGLEKAGGKLSSLGTEVQKAGIIIVTAAAGLANMSSGFESGLAKVNTLVMDSKEGLTNYGQAVMDLSDNTGVEVTNLTDALYDAISAGVDYASSVDFINDINKVAVGGFTDIGSASKLMTQVMNIYGKSVEDVGDISNKLFLVQKNGVTTVGELAANMGEAMTMGSSYNVSLENILSSYASLTKQGRTASTAQTQLKAMIQELGDTGSNTGKILEEKTGKSFTALMQEGNNLYDVLNIVKESCGGNEDAFNNLWSSTEAGLSAMSLLSKDGEYFNSTLNDMANSAGLTDKAFNEIAETSEYKFKKSINEAKNSLTKLGQSLLPFMDQVSKGISNVAKYISKLSPETVKAVAKFGALALAFGTTMKVTGSLVTVLGKGCTGISALLKIAADTKSLGSFTKALGQSESAVGGLVKGLGGLTLKGGVVGLAVAGVAALGTAFYMNQKEIEESEKRYDELGGKIGEFTGRLRSNENTWTEIFGKEYSWKFSEEYKTALDNAEGDVANWVETLKGYQDQIYAILNSTEINQQTKDEQVATLIKDTIGAGNIDDQVNSLTSGMSERGFSPEQINKTVEDFKKAMSGTYSEIEGLELKGLEMVKQYTTTTIDEMGNQVTNVDWDGFNKDFSEYLNENHNAIVTSQNENYDDLLEITQKYTDEQNILYGKATEGSLEYNKKTVENTIKAKKEEIEALRKNAKEHGQLTEEYNNNLNKQINELDNLERAQKSTLLRRAAYDEEYAKANKIMVDQIAEGAWIITDTTNGMSTALFDTTAAMEEWAGRNGYYTTEIEDQFGNMKSVVVDQTGAIVGMMDTGAQTFGWFKDEAVSSVNAVIDSLGLTGATAEEKFAAICAAIDDGTLSAEAFGMTDAEFKAAAGAMVNAGGDATTLKNKLNEIPKNVSPKVEVTGVDTATGKVEGLLTKLGNLGSKVWSAAVNVATSAGNFFGFENGGTVNESGVYNTQEAGLELIDTPSYTNAYSLGDVARGELTYIPANSKVTNAAMTSLKMESMIDSKLRSVMSIYMNDLNKSLINILKDGELNKDFKIIMHDPHFENKPSEQQNINNIKRIISGMK